ncbi:hypothetical protein ABZW96_19725 [Nocardia sp. NPDC004168]
MNAVGQPGTSSAEFAQRAERKGLPLEAHERIDRSASLKGIAVEEQAGR